MSLAVTGNSRHVTDAMRRVGCSGSAAPPQDPQFFSTSPRARRSASHGSAHARSTGKRTMPTAAAREPHACGLTAVPATAPRLLRPQSPVVRSPAGAPCPDILRTHRQLSTGFVIPRGDCCPSCTSPICRPTWRRSRAGCASVARRAVRPQREARHCASSPAPGDRWSPVVARIADPGDAVIDRRAPAAVASWPEVCYP